MGGKGKRYSRSHRRSSGLDVLRSQVESAVSVNNLEGQAKRLEKELRPHAKRFNKSRLLPLTLLVLTGILVWKLSEDAVDKLRLKPKPKIIGGDDVQPGVYPHAVSIQWRGAHVCGGTLVAEDLVLTAAHCTVMMGRFQWMNTVVVGAHDVTKREKEQERFEILEVRAHPDFDLELLMKGQNSDLALIRIAGKAKQKPLRLGFDENVLGDGDACTVAGWGVTSLDEREPSDSKLKSLQMKTVSNEKCSESYALIRVGVDPHDVCALPKNKASWDASLFFGDSGSALFKQVNGESVAVGVVSNGFPLVKLNGGFPTRFTNVAHFKNWIQDELDRPVPEGLKPPRPSLGYYVGATVLVTLGVGIGLPLAVTAGINRVFSYAAPFLIVGSLIANYWYGRKLAINQTNEWMAPIGISSVVFLLAFPSMSIVFYSVALFYYGTQ